MKKAEIRVGGIYAAKVSGKVVPVRIAQENPRGGWDAVNMVTERWVYIKTAARLRFEFEKQTVDGRSFLVAKGNRVISMGLKEGA